MIKLKNIKKTDEWIEAMYAEIHSESDQGTWGYLRLSIPEGEPLEFKAGRGSYCVVRHTLLDLAKRETVPETCTRIYH